MHTFIPLEDFKALLGIDSREDALSQYCLVTATCAIEQYCRRRLLRKTCHERIERSGDLILSLREYPVHEVLALYVHYHFDQPDLVEPELYCLAPESGDIEDIPHLIRLSPALRRLRGAAFFKAVYSAGYECGEAPADLASACMELAFWNLGRYKGRKIGITGNVRGSGKEGEYFEGAMPANVRMLLEPYRRKLI